MTDDQVANASAFRFTGHWREYAPIAFTNLLLTIVTLGVYTFWARARTRRYLWSRTEFIDDRLEWTGTGLELFIGYVIAFFLFILPFGIINLVLQGTLMRGHQGAAGLIVGLLYLFILFLFGVARFRALRYRLSRTFWRGIRGGSDRQGVGYGWSYFWRTLLSFAVLYLTTPWAMATLWNERWEAMSFGSMSFRADAQWRPVFSRFLLFYLAPIILVVAGGALIGFLVGSGALRDGAPPSLGAIGAIVAAAVLFYILFFGVLGLIAMIYYAAFFRQAVGATSWDTLDFGFGARTKDWVLLYLGNVALVLVTFGIGLIFVQYRNWAFFVRHMEAYGEIAVDMLGQSQTREPGQGEGLLDAFDVGAF